MQIDLGCRRGTKGDRSCPWYWGGHDECKSSNGWCDSLWSSTTSEACGWKLPLWRQGSQEADQAGSCHEGGGPQGVGEVEPAASRHWSIRSSIFGLEKVSWAFQEVVYLLSQADVDLERIFVFLLMIFGDLLVFGGIIAAIIYFCGPKKMVAIQVGAHRFFHRPRMRHKLGGGRKRTATLFIALLMQTHVGTHGRSVFENDNVDSKNVNVGNQFDEHSLMARSSASWQPPPLPVQHLDGARRRTASEDSTSERSNEERYVQMAFIFPFNAEAIPAKLDWNDYWALHRQVAALCGCHVNSLLAIHGVQHLPEDLEEIEVQAILPQQFQDGRQGDGQVMVLVDIEFHGGAYVNPVLTERRSRLIPKFITREGLLLFLNVHLRCRTSSASCVVWFNNVVWREQDIRQKSLRHGDYIRCALPPQEDLGARCEEDRIQPEQMVEAFDEEEDVIDLMQTRSDLLPGTPTPSSIQVRTVAVFLFGRSDQIEVDTSEGTLEDVANSLREDWEIECNDLAHFHDVQDPPFNMQIPGRRIVLLEQDHDAAFRADPSDVLALVDVALVHISGNSRTLTRRVTRICHRQRRIQLIARLGVDRLCDNQEENECVVTVNNVVWHHDDSTLRHFSSGDYLKVDISTFRSTADDALLRLRHLEICSRQNRFFTDTPSSRDSEHHSQDSVPEIERSRSRSRGGGNERAPGNVEDASWDSFAIPPGTFDFIEDFGFRFVSFDILPPPGNPSNEVSPVEPDVVVASPEWISERAEPSPRNDTAEVYVIDDEGMEDEGEVAPHQAAFRLSLPPDIHCVVSLLQPWSKTPLRLDMLGAMQDGMIRSRVFTFIRMAPVADPKNLQDLRLLCLDGILMLRKINTLWSVGQAAMVSLMMCMTSLLEPAVTLQARLKLQQ